MNYYIAAVTDIGTRRQVNQDRFYAEQFLTKRGNAVLAVLCDGMGGLQFGEIASESIVTAFSAWAKNTLSDLLSKTIEDSLIRKQWTELISLQNDKIRRIAVERDCKIGSTVTALLLTDSRFYALNIGDTRAYEFGETTRQLTLDHTVLAEEVRRGNLSEEQTKKAPIKNALTKCVGVAEKVFPDFFFGDTKKDAAYLLCSDGFRHCVTEEEMRDAFARPSGEKLSWLKASVTKMVEWNKERGETDNITAVAIYSEST